MIHPPLAPRCTFDCGVCLEIEARYRLGVEGLERFFETLFPAWCFRNYSRVIAAAIKESRAHRDWCSTATIVGPAVVGHACILCYGTDDLTRVRHCGLVTTYCQQCLDAERHQDPTDRRSSCSV